MTNSSAGGQPGKRDRLVASAAEVLHQDGLERTTLARVAEAADVPVGNVYYYFKTRDELIGAVVQERCREVSAFLAQLGAKATPRARLKALVRSWDDQAEVVACYGCPIGGLASDVGKHGAGLEDEAGQPLRLVVEWAEGQFRELGRRDAKTQAIALIAGVQGAAVLANAFRDPQLLTREVRRLERAIDSVQVAPSS